MAKTIKVNVKEQEKNNVKIPVNDCEKKLNCENIASKIELTILVDGFVRLPKVGSKVYFKRKPHPCYNCEAIEVRSASGEGYGCIFEENQNVIGSLISHKLFKSLPDQFAGKVIEVDYLDGIHKIITVEVDFSKKTETPNIFTVVSPGQSLLAPNGTFFNAVKEKRFSGSANIFAVYDGERKIGIIAPMTRVAIPGTKALTLVESVDYPNSFPVKVVGDGSYDGTNYAIKVELMLPYKVHTPTEEEIAKIDKKILEKYLAHLLNPHCEWSTKDLLMLSDKGKEKKAFLDEKYQEVVQASVKKMQAYFDLL